MAVSSLLGSAVSAWPAAPLPRPPAAHQADLDGVGDRLAGDDAGKAGRNHTGDRPGLLEEVAALNLVRVVSSVWSP